MRRAKVRLDAALTWLQRAGLDPDLLRFGPTATASAAVEYDLGDLETAEKAARAGLEAATAAAMLSEQVWALLLLTRIHLAAGDGGAAARTLGRARAAATRDAPSSGMLVPVEQAQAMVHLAGGDLLRAERVIRALPPSDNRSLLWARAGVERHPAVARRTLESVGSTMPRIQSQRHLLLAALHRRGSRTLAEGHLRKAAQIAQAQGIGRLLAGADPDSLEFAGACALEHQDDNLTWLLGFCPSPRPQEQGPAVKLSRGEVQLLAVLPTRAKNAEIAATLGVSVNTVKTRLRRLYTKLGASTRDEAIARARQRGLLGP